MLKYTTALTAIFVIAITTEVLGRGYLIPSTNQERSAENELGQPRLDGRIVGGIQSSIQNLPHQLSLQAYKSHICGASIIEKNWAMTAAHCTYGRTASQLQLRAGSSEADKGGQVISVSKIFQHPKFSFSTIDNDYSLLYFSEPIIFDETKRAIELPNASDVLLPGTMCITSGWGNTQNSSESRNWLREVTVPIFDHAECKKRYAEFGTITTQMVCAGYEAGGMDACQGDSGGPLACNGVLQAIVSWGFGCAKPGYPGVYANVAAARPWINEVTGM